MADFIFTFDQTYTPPAPDQVNFILTIPEVVATATPSTVIGDSMVALSATSNITPDSWSWSVVAGSGVILNATEQNATLILSDASAPQAVQVQVEITYQTQTYTDTVDITHNLQPVVTATATPPAFEGTGTVALSATSNLPATAWLWEIVSGVGVLTDETQQNATLSLDQDDSPQQVVLRATATINGLQYSDLVAVTHDDIVPVIVPSKEVLRGSDRVELVCDVDFEVDQYKWSVIAKDFAVSALDGQDLTIAVAASGAYQVVTVGLTITINGVDYEAEPLLIPHTDLWGSVGDTHQGLVRVNIVGE